MHVTEHLCSTVLFCRSSSYLLQKVGKPFSPVCTSASAFLLHEVDYSKRPASMGYFGIESKQKQQIPFVNMTGECFQTTSSTQSILLHFFAPKSVYRTNLENFSRSCSHYTEKINVFYLCRCNCISLPNKLESQLKTKAFISINKLTPARETGVKSWHTEISPAPGKQRVLYLQPVLLLLRDASSLGQYHIPSTTLKWSILL